MAIHAKHIESDWKQSAAIGTEDAIAQFKAELSGWWFTIGECQVSADASCGPTREAPEHLALIPQDVRFDDGFHVDLAQPATIAEALDHVRNEAIEAIRNLGASQ